jgi:hypothetical protein
MFSIYYKSLCLTTSYKKAPQATETFKDSIVPYIGNFAFSSTTFQPEGFTPRSSLPIIIATGTLKSIS